MASDVIYFTVLFLSFSFLSPSPLPYLFMMFAVNGSGLSGPVAEILIRPTTAAATTHTHPHKNGSAFTTSGLVLYFEICTPAPRLTLSFAGRANFLCVRCGVVALLSCWLGVVQHHSYLCPSCVCVAATQLEPHFHTCPNFSA